MAGTYRLKEICEFKKGKKVSIINRKTRNSVPYLLINTLRGFLPDSFTEDKFYTDAIENDVLIVCDGANSGLTGTGLCGAVGSTIARLRFDETIVDKDYITYFLKLNFSNLNTDVRGAAIPHLKQEKMLNLVIPKISLYDQNLTVQEIEKQFTRLDAAIRSLRAIKNKLEFYRRSILKAAFNGDLISFDVDVCSILGDVTSVRKEKVNPRQNPDLQYIGMADVESGTGKIIAYTSAKDMKATSAKFYHNDILYGRLRPYLNKVVLADKEGLASTEFIILMTSSNLNSSYLAWRLRVADFVRFANGLNTGDRPRVKYDQISSFKIKYPSIDMQKTIISEIESRFSVVDKVGEVVDNSLMKAERLRRSILKTAFEGKLVN